MKSEILLPFVDLFINFFNLNFRILDVLIKVEAVPCLRAKYLKSSAKKEGAKNRKWEKFILHRSILKLEQST